MPKIQTSAVTDHSGCTSMSRPRTSSTTPRRTGSHQMRRSARTRRRRWSGRRTSVPPQGVGSTRSAGAFERHGSGRPGRSAPTRANLRTGRSASRTTARPALTGAAARLPRLARMSATPASRADVDAGAAADVPAPVGDPPHGRRGPAARDVEIVDVPDRPRAPPERPAGHGAVRPRHRARPGPGHLRAQHDDRRGRGRPGLRHPAQPDPVRPRASARGLRHARRPARRHHRARVPAARPAAARGPGRGVRRAGPQRRRVCWAIETLRLRGARHRDVHPGRTASGWSRSPGTSRCWSACSPWSGPRGRRRTVKWSWNLLWVAVGVLLITAGVSLPGLVVSFLIGRVTGLGVRYLSGVLSERAYGDEPRRGRPARRVRARAAAAGWPTRPPRSAADGGARARRRPGRPGADPVHRPPPLRADDRATARSSTSSSSTATGRWSACSPGCGGRCGCAGSRAARWCRCARPPSAPRCSPTPPAPPASARPGC